MPLKAALTLMHKPYTQQYMPSHATPSHPILHVGGSFESHDDPLANRVNSDEAKGVRVLANERLIVGGKRECRTNTGRQATNRKGSHKEREIV